MGTKVTTELDTPGLILKGRFVGSAVQDVLSRYVRAFVECAACQLPDTVLAKDAVTRRTSVVCLWCGARAETPLIRTGFGSVIRTSRTQEARAQSPCDASGGAHGHEGKHT